VLSWCRRLLPARRGHDSRQAVRWGCCIRKEPRAGRHNLRCSAATPALLRHRAEPASSDLAPTSPPTSMIRHCPSRPSVLVLQNADR
jgi:hypothetical protein